MITCDACGKQTDKIFERGIWYCRKCYIKAVLKPKIAKEFDEDNAEKLADVLYDDYWSPTDYIAFRREEE